MIRTLLALAFLLVVGWMLSRTFRQIGVQAFTEKFDDPKENCSHKAIRIKSTIGGLIISLSFGLALVSLFLDWANVSFLFWHLSSKSGIALGLIYVLVVWAYPTSQSLRGEFLQLWSWVACSVLALALPVYLWQKIDHARLFIAIDIDAGIGVSSFSVAGLMLAIGMVLHQVHCAVRYFINRSLVA